MRESYYRNMNKCCVMLIGTHFCTFISRDRFQADEGMLSCPEYKVAAQYSVSIRSVLGHGRMAGTWHTMMLLYIATAAWKGSRAARFRIWLIW